MKVKGRGRGFLVVLSWKMWAEESRVRVPEAELWAKTWRVRAVGMRVSGVSGGCGA